MASPPASPLVSVGAMAPLASMIMATSVAANMAVESLWASWTPCGFVSFLRTVTELEPGDSRVLARTIAQKVLGFPSPAGSESAAYS